MTRFSDQLTRWAGALTFLLGVFVLLPGLGQSGLWGPWEMERSKLARDLMQRPFVVAALGPDASGVNPGLSEQLQASADDADVALRIEQTLDTKARGVAAGAKMVRDALDAASAQVAAGVVLDLGLLVRSAQSPVSWKRLAERVEEALSLVPSGQVILLSREAELTVEMVTRGLAAGHLHLTESEDPERYGVTPFPMPEGGLSWSAPELESAHLPSRLVVLLQPTTASLTDALVTAGSRGLAVVRFKDDGATRALAPLQTWLIRGAYGLMGVSETSTRLPGALLALCILGLLIRLGRELWSPRVGAMAGAVLVTCPLFYGQARSAAGETGLMLALTLVAGAILLEGRGASFRRTQRWLWPGLVIAFLAAGLTGLLAAALMLLAVTVVVSPGEPRRWVAPLLAWTALGLGALWVLTSPADGFAGQFRFTHRLFSAGPDLYDRNFDFVVRQLGFGLFPWTPLVILGAGAILIGEAREAQQGRGLVVLAWFAVPALLVMGMLKGMNHFVWPAAPAAALLVALLLERVLTEEVRNRWLALVAVMVAMILLKDLRNSPEPLSSFLTYDPPFTDQGAGRFPEAVALGWMGLVATAGVLVLCVSMSRVVSAAQSVVSFFRRPLVSVIGSGLVVVAIPLVWFITVYNKYWFGMRLDGAKALGSPFTTWWTTFLGSADPAVMLSWLALYGGALLLVFRAAAVAGWARLLALAPLVVLGWVLFGATVRVMPPPVWGPSLAMALVATCCLLPPLARGLRWLVVRAFGWVPHAVPFTAGVAVASACWIALGIGMVFSVRAPAGYAAEALLHVSVIIPLLGAVGVAVLTWRGLRAHGEGSSRALLLAVGAAVAVLGLFLGTRLCRDADHHPWYATVTAVVGGLAWARVVLPTLLARDDRTTLGGCALLALGLLGLVTPLMHRWDVMTPALYPGSTDSLIAYLLWGSLTTWILVGLLGFLWSNSRLSRKVDLVLGWGQHLERGPVAVVALFGTAVVFTACSLTGYYSQLSYHVSQKHIVETYRGAEGLAAGAVDDDIFRHGRFASVGARDVNFYTSNIPEIRDRKAAMQVLLGTRDRVVDLDAPEGTTTTLVPGWDGANDGDGDGVRDEQSVHGIATSTSPGRLVDTAQNWPPDVHVGRVVRDTNGKAFTITGNDATSLSLADAGRPLCPVRKPQHCGYSIDGADAVVGGASANNRRRHYMLLPAGSFSELNHAFRKVSGGTHIPVLDGRSSRVLLASSWLEEGEEQQNRFARHTIDRDAFDALDGPNVHRGWADFDGKLRVIGYEMEEEAVSRGQRFRLTTYIQVLKPVTKSYKIFMHIDRSGTSNRIHGDHWPLNLTEGGEDDKACTGCYRSDHWMEGDVIVDVLEREVPIGTPSGPQEIWMGFFSPTDDKRLPVKSWDRGQLRHDGQNRVRIGSFQVR